MNMFLRLLLSSLCILLTGISLAGTTDPTQKAPPKADVRVIIDVSGSMKKNDPDNLRVPALKLLVGLLPENIKAGVWTFGTKVKPLVKHGSVNKRWKNKANNSVNKITSSDMFTDVERALKLVSKDWNDVGDNGSSYKRNIILLTDGMVDVSKDQSKTEVSRQRILDQVLPELQRKGVTIHTISLSENADLEIMDALAVATDGSSELVNSADQLQRVFLHMFEKSTPRDTVPLEDNQFIIDKMINEFTLLVFRNNDIKQTTVIPPKGKKFTRKTAPKNVAWLEENGYDLITITKPTAGAWKVDADMDPDNRVMVVSKLKLHTAEFPNSVFLGENFNYKFWMMAGNKTIKKEAFYNLIDVKMLQTSSNQIEEVWELDKRDSDNKFNLNIGKTFEPGKLELTVLVDGKTFKRQYKQTVDVHEKTYDLEIKTFVETNGESMHVIYVSPKKDLIDLNAFNIVAEITAPDQSKKQLKGARSTNSDEWLVTIKDPQSGEYDVVLEVAGKSKSGREISVKGTPFKIGGFLSNEEESDVQEPEDVTEELVNNEEGETDWMQIGISLLIVNVVLFGLIGGGWFFLKKRKKNAVEQPGDDL